ncbi:MAG: DUF2064 domain-containing protein [Ornithinimicrobium sp.]
MKVLVMAKAPVPGLAKTRLGAVIGYEAAADLAAAGLLDTMAVCREAGAEGVIALTGDLDEAMRAEEIRTALADWTIVWQRGDGFADRLANAHLDAGPGPLFQVGMDTPQLTTAHLESAASALLRHDTVLGPAEDGGWWGLGLHDPADAHALRGVPMSTSHTCEDTHSALRSRGLSVGRVETLRDVDQVDDAEVVAASAPHTRFARAWATKGVHP